LDSYFGDLSAIINALRKKVIVLFSIFFIAFCLFWGVTGTVINSIKTDLLPEGAKLVYVSPLEIMLLKMKIALVLSLFTVIPVMLYMALKIILQRKKIQINIDSKFWLPISLIMLITFVGGVCYAYFFMLPLFIDYLYVDASASGVVATYSIFSFISFAVQTSIIFGFVFQTPIILFLLNRFGLVQYSTLVSYRKHIYIICLVVAAFITPSPDIFSMVMVSIPLIILFELSLLIVRISNIGRKENKTT
jgi:sec-independent protein translocase protein TatC